MALVSPHPRLRLYTRWQDYLRTLSEIATGRWRTAKSVDDLEIQLASKLGVEHALAMPMARVGIYFAIRVLIKPGQNVILSPYTIADVVNMVICAGGIPVFADIETATCNIDVKEVEKLIDGNTGAVLVTHFYGCVCDVEAIVQICRKRNIPVIEDAAQAFGATVGGRYAGTIGQVGIFSFGLYKNVTSFFGGMLVTNDGNLHRRVADMIHGAPVMEPSLLMKKVVAGAITDTITWPPLFALFTSRIFRLAFLKHIAAINNRLKIDTDPKKKTSLPEHYLRQMSPLQARLVCSQLDRVDRHIDRRIEVAHQYHDGLHDLEQLVLPPLRLDRSHMYWYYPVQYAERHELVKFAMRQKRDIAESYHRNCADLPCFAEYYRDCPVARKVANSVIYLPTYPGYPSREVDANILSIRRFFGKA